MMKTRYIWMMVTEDKYELPVAVADSAAELAHMVGVNRVSVIQGVTRVERGMFKRSKYVRVEVED